MLHAIWLLTRNCNFAKHQSIFSVELNRKSLKVSNACLTARS